MTGFSGLFHVPQPEGPPIPAYLAAPPAGEYGPGVLIIPPIFGVDPGMQRLADYFALRGAVALVPDPFWRDPRSGPLGFGEADRALARERAERFDREQGLADFEAALAALLAHPACNGHVAVLGVCFGGRYALVLAARRRVEAGIAWHGVGLLEHRGLAPAIRCPLSLHFGEDDTLVPRDEVSRIRRAFGRYKHVAIHVHPGVGHGFTHRGHPGYDPVASNAAFADACRILARLR